MLPSPRILAASAAAALAALGVATSSLAHTSEERECGTLKTKRYEMTVESHKVTCRKARRVIRYYVLKKKAPSRKWKCRRGFSWLPYKRACYVRAAPARAVWTPTFKRRPKPPPPPPPPPETQP